MAGHLGAPTLQFFVSPHQAAAARSQTPPQAGSPLRALERKPASIMIESLFR